MKQLVLLPLVVVFTLLGVIGILVPVLPGILFFLMALVCLGIAYPSMRRRLEQQPRLKRFFYRLDETRYLGIAAKGKLFFWAVLEMVTPQNGRTH